LSDAEDGGREKLSGFSKSGRLLGPHQHPHRSDWTRRRDDKRETLSTMGDWFLKRVRGGPNGILEQFPDPLAQSRGHINTGNSRIVPADAKHSSLGIFIPLQFVFVQHLKQHSQSSRVLPTTGNRRLSLVGGRQTEFWSST